MEIIKSEIDNSVNFIIEAEKGKFEARFVQRDTSYFIVYLSSQSGCNQACRMCHLTNTKQTQLVDATVEDYIHQALAVLKYYKENIDKPVDKIHFNFMARGEPLANENFIKNNALIFARLKQLFISYSKHFRFNVSTILPLKFLGLANLHYPYKGGAPELYNVFKNAFLYGLAPTIYYSAYSTNKHFRDEWLPNSVTLEYGLKLLKVWQDKTYLIPKIHFAFIEGENDSVDSVRDLCYEIVKSGLKTNVNIVRYNPYSERYGKESSEEIIHRNAFMLEDLLNCKVKVIPKVGYDVKASCGMFVEKSKW